MNKIKAYPNPGVDGAGGYEFQKHCALYIFLEKYADIKDSKYFICLEHHEDFLFCYLNEVELIKNIDTYQAKKSSKNWTLSNLKDIIPKILEVGIDLKNDDFNKIDEYLHNLHFLTNHSIILSKGKTKNIINERNEILKFNDLYDEIKKELQYFTNKDTEVEIVNLIFSYIDFNKTFKAQKQRLVGMFNDVFGNTILDHKASIETLLSLFNDAVNTLNQRNIVSLMDKSKRVESEQINKTLNILTTKQKAFDEWRELKNEYSNLLKIPIKEHNHFELEFENAFDYFKDLTQVEHQKIKNFVKKMDFSECFSLEKGLETVINSFNQEHNTQFDSITVKASILSSYIQVREGLE